MTQTGAGAASSCGSKVILGARRQAVKHKAHRRCKSVTVDAARGRGSQAQGVVRARRAATSDTATRTHGGIWTYFWYRLL